MVQRTVRFDVGLRLFFTALARGGDRKGVTWAETDVSAGCQSPVTVSYVGRRDTIMLKSHVVKPDARDPTTWESVETIMHVKCRQCDECMRKRRSHWWHRAKAEMAYAPRTWFATFTYAPAEILKREIDVSRKLRVQGIDFDALAPEERYSSLVDRTGKDITLFMKRVRKSGKGPVRYLVVSEAHKSGLPHYHALIHEMVSGAATYDLLRKSWPWGFTQFKLADPEAVSYVAKYISKDAKCRVRASEHYGKDTAYASEAAKRLRSAAAEGK